MSLSYSCAEGSPDRGRASGCDLEYFGFCLRTSLHAVMRKADLKRLVLMGSGPLDFDGFE